MVVYKQRETTSQNTMPYDVTSSRWYKEIHNQEVRLSMCCSMLVFAAILTNGNFERCMIANRVSNNLVKQRKPRCQPDFCTR